MNFYEAWHKLVEFGVDNNSAIKAPAKVAKTWYQNVPAKSDDIDTNVCKYIANELGNPHIHQNAFCQALAGIDNRALVCVDDNIIGSVIKSTIAPDKKKRPLGKIDGGVVISQDEEFASRFGFHYGEDKVGKIDLYIIALPFCGMADIAALYGAAVHETRHAYDWLTGHMNERPMPTTPQPPISIQEYLMDRDEVRAFSEEMIHLMELCMDDFGKDWDTAARMVVSLDAGAASVGEDRRAPVVEKFLKLLKSRANINRKWNRQEATVAQFTTIQQLVYHIRQKINRMIDKEAAKGQRLIRKIHQRCQ